MSDLPRWSAAMMLSSMTIQVDSQGKQTVVAQSYGRTAACIGRDLVAGQNRHRGGGIEFLPLRLTTTCPFTPVIEPTGPSALAGG